MSRITVLESTGLALVSDSRIDVEAGIIRGVRVIGQKSANGRTYPADLLRARHMVYENAHVFLDHDYTTLRTGRARPVGQWGAVLRGVAFRGEGVHGDLECFRATDAGKIILEAAQRFPDKFGLSPMHAIESRKEADGTETVTAIIECFSVDAVTRPATNRTLFEQDETMPDEPAPAAGATNGAGLEDVPTLEAAFNVLHTALMASAEYDDNEKMAFWKDLIKFKNKWLGDGEEEPAEEAPAEESETRRPLGRQARRLEEMERAIRAVSIRQMAGESLQIDAVTMATLLKLDEVGVANYLDQLRRTTRRRYSSGPARSTGRTVSEAQGGRAAPAAIPRLSAGADREVVKRFYRS